MLELFVNPFLLGGLAFASLPVIIHLLNRRRYEVHDFAAMDFLLQAQVMNRRRVRLEDLILLLLRMLLIALLVFAVARPLLKGISGWREDRREIVIDDSGSMDVTVATGTVLTAALEGAENQVRDAFGASTAVSIRLGSQPLESALAVDGDIQGGDVGSDEAKAAEKGSDLLDDLGKIEPVDARLRFDRIVERVLEEASADESPLVRNVVLLSDFRKADWLGPGGELVPQIAYAFEEVERRELEKRIRFQFVDLSTAETENVSVRDLRVEGGHVLAGLPTRLVVEVENHGTRVRERVDGFVEVGEPGVFDFAPTRRIPLPSLNDLGPGERRSVEVSHLFESAGEFPVRVELEGDVLARDDRDVLVVPVREALRVVIFDRSRATERLARESGFLIAALQPRGDDPSGILPTVESGAIRAEALEEADVALVLNRPEFASSECDVLADFLEKGGGVGFFLGKDCTAKGYRELATRATRLSLRDLPPTEESSESSSEVEASSESAPSESATQVEGPPVFPAALGAVVHERGQRRFMRIRQTEHPLLDVFLGLEGISIEKVLFDRYLKLDVDESAQVLAVYDDDDATPAIVEQLIGRGRAVVFNTSADRGWGDWPTHLSYPILLQELARYLAPERSAELSLTVGEPLVWESEPGASYEILTPKGEKETIEKPTDASRFLDFPATVNAGFYRLLTRDTPSAEPSLRWFACRRAASESQLARVGEAELEALFASTGIDYSVGAKLDVDDLRKEQEGEIWRYMALAAGLFLLLELFMAWWFARRS